MTRVVLIGGTSNTGKSTIAREVAERLGYAYRSTDKIARHPGRPWRTAEREVPPHVARHYAMFTPDELLTAVLRHYERMWPRIETLVRSADGLVLEGSGVWPERVAAVDLPGTYAVWLTADPAVIRSRIRDGGRYAEAGPYERLLMDKFLARSLRYQDRMRDAVERHGLARLDVTGRSVEKSVRAVLDGAAKMGP